MRVIALRAPANDDASGGDAGRWSPLVAMLVLGAVCTAAWMAIIEAVMAAIRLRG